MSFSDLMRASPSWYEQKIEKLEAEIARKGEALRRITEKCRQYANAPQLCVEEQHAVLEFIERAALAPLSASAE